MKNALKTTLFGAALLAAAAGFAQSSTSPQKGDEDPTPTSSMTSKTTTGTDTRSTGSANGSTSGSPAGTYRSTGASTAAPRTYTGTVKTLDAGRMLVITMANGRTQTFDISSSPAMNASVAVGSRVRVKQSVDADGHTVVTVEPYR